MPLLMLITIFFTGATHVTADEKPVVINNSWYTMQAGSVPWGYFHEVIEKRGKRYSYRSVMTKYEDDRSTYQESVGALADEDLTPIALNIVKSGKGASEIINAGFKPKKTGTGGVVNFEIKGAKNAAFPRTLGKGGIFDVFFPVWLSNHWGDLKPGYRGRVYVMAEDPEQGDFLQQTVSFQAGDMNSEDKCRKLDVTMGRLKSKWCVTREGALVTLEVAGRLVKKVKNEAEAKAFVSGIAPKKE